MKGKNMAEMQRQIPEDFHALYDMGARAQRGTLPRTVLPTETEGHSRLARDVPDLTVDYDEATQLPVPHR